MDAAQYKILFDLEANYWWHVGLRNLITSVVRLKTKNKADIKILDAGCGTGGNLAALDKLGYAVGLDLFAEAINFCKQNGINKLIEGSVSSLPFKNNCFDVLLSIDVLYHREVYNDSLVLENFFRVLKKDGILILHLPAFEFLRGPHDVAVHTQRRYTVGNIKKKILSAGFKIERITYRNFIFFLVVLFLRRLNKRQKMAEFKRLPIWINMILINLINLENLVINNFFQFPFGVSILTVAKKI